MQADAAKKQFAFRKPWAEAHASNTGHAMTPNEEKQFRRELGTAMLEFVHALGEKYFVGKDDVMRQVVTEKYRRAVETAAAMLLRSVRGDNSDAPFTLNPARQRRSLSSLGQTQIL